MSKFIDSLESELTGKKKAKLSNFTYKRQLINDPLGYDVLAKKEYVFHFRYMRRVFIEENYLNDVTKNIIKDIKLTIYGDFYNAILRLERALYEGDEEKSLMIMRDIQREIGIS